MLSEFRIERDEVSFVRVLSLHHLTASIGSGFFVEYNVGVDMRNVKR